ncbi:MAG: hypothetical protein P1U83_12065 [Roseovarius sp.]|nr:hypothetical protein [Roseovarius sp.]
MIEEVNTLYVSLCLAGLLSCSAATAETRPDCTDFTTNDRLDSHDRQWCQALAFKEAYLKGGFVESVPGSGGSARSVSSQQTRRFSTGLFLGGRSSVNGTVTIGELKRRFRLKLTSTSNTLYYGRKVQITGTASVDEGRLEIYSHVDTCPSSSSLRQRENRAGLHLVYSNGVSRTLTVN